MLHSALPLAAAWLVAALAFGVMGYRAVDTRDQDRR
jgi:hypothetical protein